MWRNLMVVMGAIGLSFSTGDTSAHPESTNLRVVDVAFHVITSARGEGAVSRDLLQAQMDVLNKAYAASGYSFVLVVSDTTANDAWFKMTPGSPEESQAKSALNVDSETTLNLYTAGPGQGLLGWATFPQQLADRPEMDGVVVHFGTLPRGSLAPYNEGDTLVHEVGSWFGLLSTSGGDCRTDNDGISDTPIHKPNYDCSTPQDTCRNRRGTDPIHNYMNFLPDACMSEFTPGQGAKMAEMCAEYRQGSCG